jgi:hypothetical protein
MHRTTIIERQATLQSDRADSLVYNHIRVPAPVPEPRARVETDSGQVVKRRRK